MNSTGKIAVVIILMCAYMVCMCITRNDADTVLGDDSSSEWEIWHQTPEPRSDDYANDIGTDAGIASYIASLEKADIYTFYDIPDEYINAGGELSEDIQKYIYEVCKEKNVPFELVIAIIERESGYKTAAVGDDGKSIGYMQINVEANRELLSELGLSDMTDPRQNIKAGVYIISRLIDKYGVRDALSAYNYGESGARRNLWNRGIYMYDYNKSIMKRMDEIREGGVRYE